MEKEVHATSPQAFQTRLVEIKKDSFQRCRLTARTHTPNADTHQKTRDKIWFQHQPRTAECRSTTHCSVHHFPRRGEKKKKSSGFNSRHLCQIHLHPDGSVGELNDKVQSLSQEQPPPDTLGAPIPPLFGDNPISSRLCPQPTPAASLDLQGLELFWIRREDKWEPQLGKGNGGRVRSGHSQRMLLLEPQELPFATFISSCNKIGGLFWPVLFSECYFLLFCTKQLSALISTTLVFLLPSLVSHWFFSLDWTSVLEGVMSLIAWSNYHLPKTSQKEKEKKKKTISVS